jgi:restriction system protein
MAIPSYETLMQPFMQLLSDRKEHNTKELIESLSKHFKLSKEDREALLEKSQKLVFDNRVGWAKTYLAKAKLIEYTKRSHFRITQRGIKAVNVKNLIIDNKHLKQFSEFNEFQTLKKPPKNKMVEDVKTAKQSITPEESLEKAYREIRDNLARELLRKVVSLTPSQFEKLVVELLVKMGYGGSIQDAGKAIGKTNDEGIDGVIKEDVLGIDKIYIQAKKWKTGTSIGRPELQKFMGALAGQGATKGIFITTSYFSKEALDYNPANVRIVRIDGTTLAQYMIDYNLGVSTTINYEVKRIDTDYFDET